MSIEKVSHVHAAGKPSAIRKKQKSHPLAEKPPDKKQQEVQKLSEEPEFGLHVSKP